MKTPSPPQEIADYAHDSKTERMFQLPKLALGILCAASLVLTFVFMKTEYGGFIFGILFVGCGGTLCWLSGKKRDVKCGKCTRPMDVTDPDWSATLFKELGGRLCGSFFAGADDRIYKEGRYRSHEAPSWSYTIQLIKQRWYVCHSCKQYLLGEKLLSVPVFKASSGIKQAIENLKSDPNVGYEMESRHAEE